MSLATTRRVQVSPPSCSCMVGAAIAASSPRSSTISRSRIEWFQWICRATARARFPRNMRSRRSRVVVAELAGELRLGRSVVFGHSIGAMVALALSQSAPELVGAVALIDPPPLSKEVWKGFAPQLIASFSGPDGPTGRRQFVEQMFLPTDDATRRAKIIETMTAVPNDIAIPLVQAIAAFDAMAVLRQCEVPVLTISSAVPTNDAASLLAANSTMTLGQTVGAGHFLQLEVPEQVNPMIERFLAIIPGGSLAAQ